MSNIYNFANRQLCEYQSIFPNTAALLDHLLFTIGNGYDFDARTGMITDLGGVSLDRCPHMTQDDWRDLIEHCHSKERQFAVQFASRFDEQPDEGKLQEKFAKYQPQNVNETHFTMESLLKDIQTTDAERKRTRYGSKHYRTYPLCNYSKIFYLNDQTPAWFLQIAVNFCNAWIEFLSQAIVIGDVSEETDSDYSDMASTLRHRDMLLSRVAELQALLAKQQKTVE